MKFVRSQFDINGEDEVLEALPKTMGIDGVDVLQKVKISIALKTEEAVKRLEQETLEKNPGSTLGGYTIRDPIGPDLTYDLMIRILSFLISKGKVERTDAEPLPVFRRID